jgi:diguanylate cyclase (GGDEF)-like protein
MPRRRPGEGRPMPYAKNRTQQIENLAPLLQSLAEDCAADGAALLNLEADIATLVVTESFPAGIAEKRLPLSPRIQAAADQGAIVTGDLLPALLTRWLGQRPAFLCLHTLHFADYDGYLLLAWRGSAPKAAIVERAIRNATIALPNLIDRHRIVAENRRLRDRLDAIMLNVSLGIAISGGIGRAHVNPIAAELLGLQTGAVGESELAEAVQRLRASSEVKSTVDVEGVAETSRTEYWMLPTRSVRGGAKRIIRSEAHAIGGSTNPGRIWLFTDVTALWESSELLKRANAALKVREAELKHYAQDLELSRASIEEQAQQAIELAEELSQQKQELEESKRESDYLANHDPLTGLNNRRAFRHALQQMIDVARGTHGQVAILFIDLDRFKAVNDTLGHDAGDQLLKQVGRLLNEALRDTDLLARFGGDEFAVATRVPAGSDFAKILGLAERIRQKLQIAVPAPAVDAPQAVIEVSATIGISLYPDDADNLDDLFICADQAMYAGKKVGRNRVVSFRELMPS